MDIYAKRVCVATYTDAGYLQRAKTTIHELRTNGKFFGDIVVMTDGTFKIDQRFILKYNLTIKEYPDIDVSNLIEQIKKHPFKDSDGREYNKTKQWNKLYVFDTYFKQWDFVFFFDAGMRIFDSLDYFYPQFKSGALVAMDDGHPEFTKKFDSQIELSNTEVVDKLKTIYDIRGNYFLNCMFMFDTALITDTTLQELIAMMNEYPICKTNEMAVMNIYFKSVWVPLRIYLADERILFDWTERGNRPRSDYITLKYPR